MLRRKRDDFVKVGREELPLTAKKQPRISWRRGVGRSSFSRMGNNWLSVAFSGVVFLIINLQSRHDTTRKVHPIENNLLLRNQQEGSQGRNNQEEAIDKTTKRQNVLTRGNSDEFEFQVSPTANMANQMLRSKGVLLRFDERQLLQIGRYATFDQNGMDYMPASFVHASMQAPNVLFKGWPEEGKVFEKGPRVFYLIGSKFEPDASMSDRDDQKVVDCRAYYPLDAGSEGRNYRIKNNPWGTSCSKNQNMRSVQDLYNVTNG